MGIAMRTAMVLVLLVAVGCAQIEPETKLSFDPWTHSVRFRDSKDNDVTVEGLTYDPKNGGFKLDSLIIINKSSPVIEQNVQQMMAFVEQQRAANEGITAAFKGLAESISSLGGALGTVLERLPETRTQVDTPIGTGEVNITQPG